MGRIKVYANATERQRAYRARAPKLDAPAITPRKERLNSRPMRLAAIEQQIQILLEEYEGWAERMPESLRGSDQAEMLADTIEKLTNLNDILSEINPPRGFGRD